MDKSNAAKSGTDAFLDVSHIFGEGTALEIADGATAVEGNADSAAGGENNKPPVTGDKATPHCTAQ